MGHTAYFYFAADEFPRAQWDDVLTLFEARLFEPRVCDEEVREIPKLPARLSGWVVGDGRGELLCELFDARTYRYLDLPEFHWLAVFDFSHDAFDVLCNARLAYAALSLMPRTLFYDSRYDIFCCSPQELKSIYLPILEKRFVAQGLSKMFKQGILNSEGKLIFDL